MTVEEKSAVGRIAGAAALALVALIFGFFNGVQPLLRQSERIANSEETDGRILQTDFEPVSGAPGYFLPDLEYEYTIEGHTYAGDMVGLDFEWGEDIEYRFDERDMVAERFPPGETVTVYYWRGDPERSWLINQVHFYYYVFVLIGAAALFGAWVVLRSSERKRVERSLKEGATAFAVIAGIACFHYGGIPSEYAKDKALRIIGVLLLAAAVVVIAFMFPRMGKGRGDGRAVE